MTEQQATQWLVTITAEADVVHGDPERCDDECRDRCCAARERNAA